MLLAEIEDKIAEEDSGEVYYIECKGKRYIAWRDSHNPYTHIFCMTTLKPIGHFCYIPDSYEEYETLEAKLVNNWTTET